MSRYYRDPAPPTRWDADRFTRERDYREVDEYYAPAPPPRRAARPVYEDERYYYEEDRYGPRGSRVERQYFEDDEYYDPRAPRGQMIPYRPARPMRPEEPPRPGLLRRQSSLDTFDRPPARRYDDVGYRPPPRPQRIDFDVPAPPSPQTNRYRASRPARPGHYDYDYREYYDDVAIADPDYYGDDGFREFREREWVSRRRRDSSESKSRAPDEVEEKKEFKEDIKEEVKSSRGSVVRKEEIKEDFKEEIKEKPYPRRGKTKMPKRLVHTKVLFDLGYPFYEEGDKTIIIEKALGPDNIDEVFAKSREYREREVSTTRLIEAPPPAPKSQTTRAPSVHESIHESVRESLREDLRQSEVRTKPLSEAPRSVREWDQLTVKEDDRRTSRSSRTRSRARSKSRRREEDDTEIVFEKKSTVIEREPSPEREKRRRRRRSKSARRRSSVSSVDETEIIERRIVTEQDDFMPIESEELRVGPLVMAKDIRRASRSDRDIKEEIRRLEAESRALRRERRESLDDVEIVKIDRTRSISPRREVIIDRRSRSISPRREVIIERRSRSPSVRGEYLRDGEIIIQQRDIEQRGDELVEVRRDRRDRSFSRTRAPSAGLVKAMLYTAT